MSTHDDHYRTLDVAPDASDAEIRAAWRLRIVAFHPDRFRDEDQRRHAQELTQQANAAWLVLGDPVQRARYDRLRADGSRPHETNSSPAPVRRHVPCPSCAASCAANDTGGRLSALRCAACGQEFSAIIGAHMVDRPHLTGGWLRLGYRLLVANDDGELETLSFRRFPQELALSDGQLLSVVFHPTTGRPVYAIAHREHLNLGWRVR